MKITINKNVQAQLHKQHVDNVIAKAKGTADRGSDLFYYPIPRGINLSAHELISMVEEETEDTVYGGYKCIKDGEIKFRIRD